MVGAAFSCLTACSGVLDPAGPIGAGNRILLLNSLAIMLAIVIPTIVALLAFALWFRASNDKATYRPDWAFSGRIELIVWSIPVLVVLFLSGVIWIGSHQLDPATPIKSRTKAIEVQVVSLDWKWLFLYPGQNVASVNRLVVPAGVPIHFTLTSASVMNAFFVPRLGSMIYTMNGMTTQLYLQADRPGTYYGQSAHFSGDGFANMHFQVDAVSPAMFAGWAASARGAGPVLDRAGYEALAKPTLGAAPTTYRAVDPRLFDAIVRQVIPPATGPRPKASPQPAPAT